MKTNAECLTKSGLESIFFTDIGGKAACLICPQTVAVFKEYNLKGHFQTKHASFGHNLSKQELQKKANDLVKCSKQQQTMFPKTSTLQRNATKVSFILANKIAKQNKSFAEAEFIKDCMVDAVSVVCPKVIPKVEAITLSRRTVVCCIGAMASNIQEQLLTASSKFQWFAIALDESNDIQDTAQLLIYIRGID